MFGHTIPVLQQRGFTMDAVTFAADGAAAWSSRFVACPADQLGGLGARRPTDARSTGVSPSREAATSRSRRWGLVTPSPTTHECP